MFDIDLGGNWADELLERMQAPGQREKMQKAFNATPEELGKAAVEQAKSSNAEVIRLVSEIQDIAKK